MQDDKVYPLSFTIGGQRYNIRTSEDRSVILNAVKDADGKVCELMKEKLSYQQALVLVILEYAGASDKEKKEIEKYRGMLGDYLRDAADAKLECERLKRENERLRKKIISHN